MSGGADEWRRRRSPCHGLVVRYVHALFYRFCVHVDPVDRMCRTLKARHKRIARRCTGPSTAAFPSLLQCAVVGCAEAPEIVPEGPGYRC